MSRSPRRQFLRAAGALGAFLAAGPALAARAAASRVVVVGGGWAGMTAARHLRRLAPELNVSLVDHEAEFVSLALSNHWLVGLPGSALRRQDHALTARAFGYDFVRAAVLGIERDARRVVTAAGKLDFDWLVLAPGIRHDYSPWFGADSAAAEAARTRFPAGAMAGELAALKRKLAGFGGGDFVMVLPPGASRCPPAPYERAVMIAWHFRRRGLRARVVVVDPGPGMQVYNRIFAERFADRIVHLTHAKVTAIDPFARKLSTEVDDLRFDDGILMPPQQAADIVHDAGLAAPGGWAPVDPLHLHVAGDERVFIAGDAIDRVSALFGHYPKSGHLASRLGRIIAAEIAIRARGGVPPPNLPDSVCHVRTMLEPDEAARIEVAYRLRGDGVIAQTVRQRLEPQPRGEDEAWAREIHAEFLAPE